jgi:hypothetical protein
MRGAMDNNTLQIASIREVNQMNPDTRMVEPYMVVTFKVGAHGPFTESFLKADFDPHTVNSRIMAFVSKLGLVQGQ